MIVIVVKGGMVQSVYADKEGSYRVLDLDVKEDEKMSGEIPVEGTTSWRARAAWAKKAVEALAAENA